eukprot:859500_1
MNSLFYFFFFLLLLSITNMSFNFNQWIIKYELLSVQELFIKHAATTKSTLQFFSPSIQSFMCDPLVLSQPLMLPKIMNALHNISVSVVTIVISKEEQAVIDGINLNMKTLEGMQEEVNMLKVEYPKSRERAQESQMEQIETVSAKINTTFNQLFDAFTQRRQSLLKELNCFKLYSINDNELVLNIDDIRDLSAFLKGKEGEYNALISSDKDSVERQSEILQIGNNVNNVFTAKQNAMENSFEMIKKEIADNNKVEFHMDFRWNKTTYDQMVHDAAAFGVVMENTKLQTVDNVNSQGVAERIALKDRRIQELTQIIVKKDAHIKDLTATVHKRDSDIAGTRSNTKERNILIHKLVSDLEGKVNQVCSSHCQGLNPSCGGRGYDKEYKLLQLMRADFKAFLLHNGPLPTRRIWY